MFYRGIDGRYQFTYVKTKQYNWWTVNLKHLALEQSKNVEEWMIDFASWKVISKLAPTQKQHVEFLVEAFETVAPYSATVSRDHQFK